MKLKATNLLGPKEVFRLKYSSTEKYQISEVQEYIHTIHILDYFAFAFADDAYSEELYLSDG